MKELTTGGRWLMFSYIPNVFSNSVFDEVGLNDFSIQFKEISGNFIEIVGNLKNTLGCFRELLEYFKRMFHPGYAMIPITNKIAAKTCPNSIKYPEKCNLIKHSIISHLLDMLIQVRQ